MYVKYENRLLTLFLSVLRWVEDLPLATVQRVIHMIYPETEAFEFHSKMQSHYDIYLLRHITWGLAEGDRNFVTVIVQPPWILSPRDLELFVRCQGVRLFLIYTCVKLMDC